MIPKKIHYCWFGRGEKTKLAQKCIESWKKYCPDFEIIEWNEDNFDVNSLEYTKFTYDNKLYAYLSDYVRLWAVEKYGGVYFDTDVELINNIDDLLKKDAYFGFESDKFINTGLGFGAIQNHPAVRIMKERYEKRTENELNEEYAKYHVLTGSPKMNTYALTPYGLQQNGKMHNVCGAEILTIDYLCPYDDYTGKLNITTNSVSIHWFSKSAHGKWQIIRSKISRPLHRMKKRINSLRG